MFTLAHLSDPHLAPLPPVSARNLTGKRLLGFLNWRRERRNFHLREVLDRILDDIRRVAPDHVALTGDLINLSLPAEFVNARSWLESFGSPDWLSVVPGNHDAYVPMPWSEGLGLWQEYMSGDEPAAGKAGAMATGPGFPYVRRRGDVALVGLSSAVPSPPFFATGALGATQIDQLGDILENLRNEGCYRVVMIHHPPLPGQISPRKALRDAASLATVLRSSGAELVIHGHSHLDTHSVLETANGRTHVFAVPSASAGLVTNKPLAGYNLYRIRRDGNRWACEVVKRGLDAASRSIVERLRFEL